MQQKTAIFLIGPQGSGKGTQAKLLSKKLGYFHWDMGAILREIAAGQSELGKEVKENIDRGVLLTDEMLLKVAESKLTQTVACDGVVFDGLPRRIGQAEYIFKFLKDNNFAKLITFFIAIPENETLKRLQLRAEKEGRADDNKEAVLFRLKQYKQDTAPVIAFLKHNTEFFEIDGTPDIATVAQNINSQLKI